MLLTSISVIPVSIQTFYISKAETGTRVLPWPVVPLLSLGRQNPDSTRHERTVPVFWAGHKHEGEVRWGEEGCNVLCWWYSVSFGCIWVLSLQPYGPCRHYIECSEMLMGLYVPKTLGASGAGLQQTAILKTLICPWLSLMVWHCFMGLFGQESHPQHSPPGHQALWFAYHSPRGSDEQTDNWRLMVFWETAVRRVYFHVSTAWFVGLPRLMG